MKSKDVVPRRVAAVKAAVAVFKLRRGHGRYLNPKQQPRYLRAGLRAPLPSKSTTPWRQLISCGTSSDFIVSINFDSTASFMSYYRN